VGKAGDEARVGQQGTLTHVWADKGSRPRAPRDQRHRSAYLFGAACPARLAGAALVLPCVSAEAMNAHLAEISTQLAAGAHAILVLDGAGWHQSGGRLPLPNNISLLKLPPPAFAGAGSTAPNSTRSKTSGSSSGETSSATASSTPTRKVIVRAVPGRGITLKAEGLLVGSKQKSLLRD